MRYLTNEEERIIKEKGIWDALVRTARNSRCVKSQRGAVITEKRNNNIISTGFNKPLPPYEDICIKEFCPRLKPWGQDSNFCFAIHAEQMAVINTPIKKRSGAKLYHLKLKNGEPTPSGQPSCTICSKIIFDAGIAEIFLWHKEGWRAYSAEEFNRLSFMPIILRKTYALPEIFTEKLK